MSNAASLALTPPGQFHLCTALASEKVLTLFGALNLVPLAGRRIWPPLMDMVGGRLCG